MKLKNDHIYAIVTKIIGRYMLGEAIILICVLLIKKGLVTIEDIEETFPSVEEEKNTEKSKKWYQL